MKNILIGIVLYALALVVWYFHTIQLKETHKSLACGQFTRSELEGEEKVVVISTPLHSTL